jgi:hypothetical protein
MDRGGVGDAVAGIAAVHEGELVVREKRDFSGRRAAVRAAEVRLR